MDHRSNYIKNMASTYYREMYTSNVSIGGDFISGKFPQLSNLQLSAINREYSVEEVHIALKDMGSMKAPGPDGIHAVFYQKAWRIIGKQLCESTIQVLEGKKELHKPMAEALMVLIPKTDNPTCIKQFRPISLYNVSYKLVTKVIVNRLKEILNDVVSPNQSSFVPQDKLQIISNLSRDDSLDTKEEGDEKINSEKNRPGESI